MASALICQHFDPNCRTLSNLLIHAENKKHSGEVTGCVYSFFYASTWTVTPCVELLICCSVRGEIGGRSPGEIDGKMGWNLLSGSERTESALMGIKATLEWESLDNVFNFFQEAEDSNLLSQIPLRNVLARLISCYSELIASLWTHSWLIPLRPACRLHANGATYSKHRSWFSRREFDWQLYCKTWMLL